MAILGNTVNRNRQFIPDFTMHYLLIMSCCVSLSFPAKDTPVELFFMVFITLSHSLLSVFAHVQYYVVGKTSFLHLFSLKALAGLFLASVSSRDRESRAPMGTENPGLPCPQPRHITTCLLSSSIPFHACSCHRNTSFCSNEGIWSQHYTEERDIK